MYLLTFLMILLSYPLMFLMVTIPIFGVLNTYLGYRAYKGTVSKGHWMSFRQKLWAARALLAAIASFVFQCYIVNVGYKA